MKKRLEKLSVRKLMLASALALLTFIGLLGAGIGLSMVNSSGFWNTAVVPQPIYALHGEITGSGDCDNVWANLDPLQWPNGILTYQINEAATWHVEEPWNGREEATFVGYIAWENEITWSGSITIQYSEVCDSSPEPPEQDPPSTVPSVAATPACTRFNLDLGHNKETGAMEPGRYVMTEVGSGSVLAEWQAEASWTDSGWIHNIPLSFAKSSWVEVYFYSQEAVAPVQLEVINPAPNTTYGWLATGLCHAVEIQFPTEWMTVHEVAE